MDPSSLAPLSPDTLFYGRYRIVRCVKSGGMGAVYEVVDQVTDRRRALKVMLAGTIQDPALRLRFAQEAKITGAIESDHIVRVSDAGFDGDSGMPFLVMDLLQGEELGGLSARRGPLPPSEVVLYLFQVARALDRTHAAGIVHRDLKPANLFLVWRDDGAPCVKILDFGVAKVAASSAMAQRTALVGTPLYMAPEQIRGDGAIGPKADIYALGQVAFALLVGTPYWMTEARSTPSVFALLQRMVAGLPELPTARAARRNVKLPPAFDAWFHQAVALDERDRFDRATTAIAQLAEALGTASPAAPAPANTPSPIPPAPSRREREPPAPSRRERELLDERPRRASAPGDAKAAGALAPRREEELTKVAHEERLRTFLRKEVLNVREQGHAKLSLLLLGVSGLDIVEERHGKKGVDRVFADLARIVHIYVPENGLLARYRGDLLAIVYPGIGRTNARAFAKVLGEKVRKHRVRRSSSMPARLVIRIGVAHLENADGTGHDLLERATRELLDQSL